MNLRSMPCLCPLAQLALQTLLMMNLGLAPGESLRRRTRKALQELIVQHKKVAAKFSEENNSERIPNGERTLMLG